MSARPTRRGLILLALAANLLLACTFGSRGAYACSCASTGSTPEDDLRESDAVFVGEVLDLKENTSGIAGGVAPNVPVELRVDAAWKGVDEQKTTVLGGDGASCGPVFERGERYLVYADRAGGGTMLAPEPCGPTKPLADAQQDLGALGPPVIVLPDAGELARTGGPPIAAAAPLLMLASLSAGALFVLRHTHS